MSAAPAPLSREQLAALTWEDATERFLSVAELAAPPALHEQLLDNVLAAAHQALTSVEGLRVLTGALRGCSLGVGRCCVHVTRCGWCCCGRSGACVLQQLPGRCRRALTLHRALLAPACLCTAQAPALAHATRQPT